MIEIITSPYVMGILFVVGVIAGWYGAEYGIIECLNRIYKKIRGKK